jgi:uncharacterized membrane protein YciS (DUF1049 family)
MLILILAIVIALVAWSLHLMQQAVDRNEFSLMLAGTLVAFSAAAMVAVYFLMGNYIGYVTGMTHTSSRALPSDVAVWVLESDSSGGNMSGVVTKVPASDPKSALQSRAVAWDAL